VIVAVAIVIMLGLGLPAGGWLLSRRQNFFAAKDTWIGRPGEIDGWLASEYQLGWTDRSRIQAAVTRGRRLDDRRLLEPALALAVRVLENRFRSVRAWRWAGLPSLALGAVFAGLGLWSLVSTGRPTLRAEGGFLLVYALEFTLVGVLHTFWLPLRIRRSARRFLEFGTDGDASGDRAER
jgi:hypothetical protein